MLRFIKRILYFLVPFSLVFWYIHQQFEMVISRSIQNGLAGFYSVDGVIFGLIVAFVIQREWEIWTALSESVRTEIYAVREMWKWSDYAEPPLRDEVRGHLTSYLQIIIAGWDKGAEAKRSNALEKEVDGLRSMFARGAFSENELNRYLRESFTNLIQARNQRLNFSNEHMPGVLKRIVILADGLLILLSLFIAVNNIYLDYLFTAAISLLAFSLILVVDDLDNPFRPGAWHLTSEGYEALLEEFKQ